MEETSGTIKTQALSELSENAVHDLNICVPQAELATPSNVVLPILPIGELQVVLDYDEVNAAWMTNFYRKYENILYTKTYQGVRNNRPKYIYKCLMCQSELNYFQSIKSHLSKHLKLYHIKCKYCDKIFNWPGNYRAHLMTYHPNKK